MCGIVGILGKGPVAGALLEALKRLEYRGYDSAGIATLAEDGTALKRCRAEGKLANLEAALAKDPLPGRTGIGHTRWATHGAPSERNAHPHMSGPVSVVHNGIIENFSELRSALAAEGVAFESDTDTEVVAHLIARELARTESPTEAMRRALAHLKGAFALAVIFAGHEDLMIGVRNGPPLAIGHGEGEMYLGSDAIALAPFTNRITFLEDGDWAVLTRERVQIFDRSHRAVTRPLTRTTAAAHLVDKGNHRHFMAKEIHEQPEVIGHTLARYVDFGAKRVAFPDLGLDLARIRRVTISACGTAYYAGLVGKYWLERWAGLAVDIDIASEFRYREAPLEPGGLALFVSQSGETADTLAALHYARAQSQQIAAIVNVTESTIARAADCVLPTLAGPEIGVASTKAFTCQLAVLAALAIAAGKARGRIDEAQEQALVGALGEVPRHISSLLADESPYEAIAHDLAKASDVLYLGRGINYPIALEGALKLKELSYIHAEGYAAGELKHGPIALIEENLPIIVVAPGDALFEKTFANMQEVAARGGRIVLLSDRAPGELADAVAHHIAMPELLPFTIPLVYALPVQLLAYHTAVFMGTDVDQPRNLAKSVTVE